MPCEANERGHHKEVQDATVEVKDRDEAIGLVVGREQTGQAIATHVAMTEDLEDE
jgi:hypothetical protein